MKAVLVDTCIWSLALRGKFPCDITAAEELTRLIYTEKAKLIDKVTIKAPSFNYFTQNLKALKYE
ncbi:MAG: hypothetical protein GQ583_03755 [Methyloprofundus sp.]|nr:hypothetical protein [Methyloprofundus sp.]